MSMPRKHYNMTFDEEVFEKYKKAIEPTGQSVSRVLETVMRLTTSKKADIIYSIFDKMFEVAKKHEKKEG